MVNCDGYYASKSKLELYFSLTPPKKILREMQFFEKAYFEGKTAIFGALEVFGHSLGLAWLFLTSKLTTLAIKRYNIPSKILTPSV